MQQNPVMIERSFLQTAAKDLDRYIARMTADILAIAGYEFNIGSPAKVADFLEAQGVELPIDRDTKKRKTGAKDIEKMSGQYPVVDQVLLHRSLVKEKGSYVEPLLLNTSDDSPYATFKFKSVGAPTGRLASGGIEEGDIKFVPMNVQSIPSANKYRPAKCRKVNNPPIEEMDAKLEIGTHTPQTVTIEEPGDDTHFDDFFEDETTTLTE